MNWQDAFFGILDGLDPNVRYPRACAALMDAVYHLYTTELFRDNVGGRWSHETLEDLEPTITNEWDYEWPLDE